LHSSANAKREQYLADHPLPDNASEEFKALVAEGDELKLWEYFKAREDAVSVPASPEAPEAPLPAPQPEPAPVAHRGHGTTLAPHPDPEVLAAMRARISKSDRTPKAPEVLPAPRLAREVDPEVLAAMRARICASTYA
jgi:hypothetical protein